MRSILVSLILMVTEAAIAQDNLSLFSEKDFEQMAVIGQYLHEKMRLEHQCAEKEDTLACVERTCPITNFSINNQSADFWKMLGLLGALTEEELKCIFKGTEAASYLIASRNLSVEIKEAKNPVEKFFEGMVQLYNHPFQKEIDGFLVGEKTENSEDEIKDILDDLEILLDEPLSSPPPLSQTEIRLFREEIERCWNVLKLEVHGIEQITLAFSMDRDGRADPKSFLLINSKGGLQKNVHKAFDFAREAILECGLYGYDLPRRKYKHWKNIEMTFDLLER